LRRPLWVSLAQHEVADKVGWEINALTSFKITSDPFLKDIILPRGLYIISSFTCPANIDNNIYLLQKKQ
jgi:hypothetical protein